MLQTGDEVMEALEQFAIDGHLGGSHFTAIGALSDAIVAYFDWRSKRYQHIELPEQVEVLSLIGDIAIDGDRPMIHAHAVVARSDGTAHGGHLVSAHVRPTLEVVLTESPHRLRRRLDPESGLALIDPAL